jgi:hypothetical protein
MSAYDLLVEPIIIDPEWLHVSRSINRARQQSFEGPLGGISDSMPTFHRELSVDLYMIFDKVWSPEKRVRSRIRRNVH